MRLRLALPAHQDRGLFRRCASRFEYGCGQVLADGIAPQGVERPRYGLLYVRQAQFFRACFKDAAQEQVCDVAEIRRH
jgi:hypothetical protein